MEVKVEQELTQKLFFVILLTILEDHGECLVEGVHVSAEEAHEEVDRDKPLFLAQKLLVA